MINQFTHNHGCSVTILISYYIERYIFSSERRFIKSQLDDKLVSVCTYKISITSSVNSFYSFWRCW